MDQSSLSAFVRLSNPALLAFGTLCYAIGPAVTDYLGLPVDRALLVLGWLVVTAVLLVGQYLHVHFSPPSISIQGTEPDAARPFRASRRLPMYSAIIVAGLLAILLSGLAVQRAAPLGSWLLLGLGIALAFAHGVPPLRLATSGYGELAVSIGLAGLVPAFAFALQTGELHRLVWLATAPLIALTFALLITRRLPEYAGDLLRERRSMLVRVGWETGMVLHDASILAAAALMAAGIAGGLPSRIGIGAAIVLPLAVAQIWQMQRIRRGFPPAWRSLSSMATALLVLTAYFILTGFLLS